MKETEKWVLQEVGAADLGDRRLNKRLIDILKKLVSSPSKSIPSTFKSWKETIAAYRFFNQTKVTPEKILSPHFESTLARIRKEKLVLIAQDTTEIDFSKRQPIEGMGYLNDEKRQGFYLHPSIAITPEKLCLGVVDLQYWIRKELGSRGNHKQKRLEEKESYCWLKGYEAANELALKAPDTVVISVSDRAGDIYELLEQLPSESNKAYWLVRCQQNRLLLAEDLSLEPKRLWDSVRGTQAIGEIEFELPEGKIYNREKAKRKPRQVRVVRQAIRVQTVCLKPTERKNGKRLVPVRLQVVHCQEINAPNEEDRLEWFLLTSLPVADAGMAMEIVRWYLARWQIELFFKIVKSGCQVEALQFSSLKATSNCIAVYLTVAWRILYLTMLGRHYPEMDSGLVFEACEWQSLYVMARKEKPPEQAPKLQEMILMLASFGGFLGRKSDGFPGSKVIWIGMQRMKDFALAWQTFHSLEPKTYV